MEEVAADEPPQPEIDYETSKPGSKVKKTRCYKDVNGYMVCEDYSSYEDAKSNNNYELTPQKKQKVDDKSTSLSDV